MTDKTIMLAYFLFSVICTCKCDDIRLPCANKNAILFLSNANDFEFLCLLFLYKQKYLLEK